MALGKKSNSKPCAHYLGNQNIPATDFELHQLDELVALSPYNSRSAYIRAAINAFAGKEVFHK